jgi:hypothetical protein
LHFKAGFRLQAEKEANQEQEDSDLAPRSSKRRKRLDLKKVKKLDLEGKVETIVKY